MESNDNHSGIDSHPWTGRIFHGNIISKTEFVDLASRTVGCLVMISILRWVYKLAYSWRHPLVLYIYMLISIGWFRKGFAISLVLYTWPISFNDLPVQNDDFP